jgi:hypoxanthine-guanine phosphoribosyltransferase
MDDTYNINGKQFKVLISREELDRTIDRIAGEINRDYKGKSPLFVVVLKGAIFFAADLLRKVNLDCEMETISAKSYGQALQSSGKFIPWHVVVVSADGRIIEE